MSAREIASVILLFGSTTVLGCSKSPPPPPEAAPSALTATATAAASPSAPAGPQQWSGSYTTTRGTLYVVKPGDAPNAKEWENTRWRGDDAGSALGEGTLAFQVDPVSGRIEGTADGALGPIKLAGLLEGNRLSLSMTRVDAADDGVVGTAWATVVADGAEGQMRLSSIKLANVLREGTFTVKRQAP